MVATSTENTSGRPNTLEEQDVSYTDVAWDKEGKVTVGTTYKFDTVRKEFTHASISSPRVAGKLRIRSNPYSMTHAETSYGIVNVRGSNPDYGGFSSYVYLSLSGGYFPSDAENLVSKATSAARSNFHKEVANASANILLALVERKEILETVLTLSTRAYKKLKEYKTILDKYNSTTSERVRKRILESRLTGFNARGLSKSKDSLADLWLFYVYAIMPLVLECISLIKHIQKIKPRAVHGRSRRFFSRSYPVNDAYFSCTREHTGYVSSHVRGYVTVVDPLQKMASEYGFTNILTILWERITYSFVIDWFVNIGSWLASLTALDGVNVSDYNETVTKKNGMSVSNFRSTNSGGWSITSTIVNSDSFMYKHKSRSVPSKVPKPQLFAEANLSWRRLLSGVALLNQNFLRLK